MRRIHKITAVGASSLLLTLALTPAALAAGDARGRAVSRIAVGVAASIPNSNITGKPAHWKPSSLSAKAKWTGANPCPQSQTSFTMTNKESTAERVTLSGPGLKSSSGKIPAGDRFGACISKGYKKTAHVALKDGKKLTVKF